MTGIGVHRLSEADLAVLATGRGDADLLGRLRAAQVSKRLLQLRALMTSARGLPTGEEAALRQGYELAADVQRHDHRLVIDVLMYPSVGIWMTHCLRRLRGTVADDQSVGTDLGHLAAIAAAAAVRAGQDFEIQIPLRDGAVMLPTVGLARFPATGPGERALVRGSHGVVEVVVGRNAVVIPQDASTDAAGWQGLRWLTVSAGAAKLAIALDDVDPFRAGNDLPPANRLTDSDLRWWQRVLSGAWARLATSHSSYANVIAAGLVMLVPLADYSGCSSMSATSREAFGACCLSRPPDAESLAVTLVHEFQHAKLGALHDLAPLYQSDRGMRTYSPWRDDPRPLSGLLQGAYAYLGVTDFWRTRMTAGGAGQSSYAAFEFARWREQTWLAAGAIGYSDRLTPTGRELVAGMRRQLSRWLLDPVPADILMAAARAIADHRVSWRLRNLRPHPIGVDTLVESWLAQAAPDPTCAASAVVWSDRTLIRNPRIDLLCEQAGGGRANVDGGLADAIHAADLAYVQGDFQSAAHHYHRLIMCDPDRQDAWAGFVLAGNWPRRSVITCAPELVYVLHRRMRELLATPPDVSELTAWLDSAREWPATGPEIWPDRMTEICR